MIWYGWAYSLVSNPNVDFFWDFLTPFLNKEYCVWNDLTGSLILRWSILGVALYFLQREARLSGLIMMHVGRNISQDSVSMAASKNELGKLSPRKLRDFPSSDNKFISMLFRRIWAVPTAIMTVWVTARVLSIKYSLNMYGWTYGLNLVATLGLVVVTIAILIYTFAYIWP